MADNPPQSFNNEQSSYLARVLRNIEGKLNDIISRFNKPITQSQIGPNVVTTGLLFTATQAALSIAAATYVKAAWTEVVDTHNCFSANRFTPNIAGWYHIEASCAFVTPSTNYVMLMKNSTGGGTGRICDGSNSNTSIIVGLGKLVFMNGTTDYLEIYVYSGVANSLNANGVYMFSGCLIRSE